MDMNKEKDCGIVLLDNELNEVTAGTDVVKKPGIAITAYMGPIISRPDVLIPVRPGDKVEEIEKLLKDWQEKWEKRKADKDKANQ